MTLFDQLVDEALKNNNKLSTLRVVVEKELLHHDILRTLTDTGLLSKLTFIGGTCLRTCYGSTRLSEDLDFTGGGDFDREMLSDMASNLIDSLHRKYGLNVKVKEPVRELGNVDTWSLQVQTRPDRKDFPAQRINIDICAIPSYQRRPMMLLNPYGVDMGTSGLIVNAQTREEIFADKLVAFALRPNRIKFRDLWDITWLHQQNIKLPVDLIPLKLENHRRSSQEYLSLLTMRIQSLSDNPKLMDEFNAEMMRFLTQESYEHMVAQSHYWMFLRTLMSDYCAQIHQAFKG